MPRPLAIDIDGTITRPAGGIDERVFGVLRDWPAPVIIATGKAFPYPIALCQFLGLPERVVAENGGVVAVDGSVTIPGDETWVTPLREALTDAGIELGWGADDVVNRWRESELAVQSSADRGALEAVAARFDLEVVDSGYAYHIKDPAVSKGRGIELACDQLGIDVDSMVAIGDSENDVSTFRVVGHAIAVANAHDVAKAAADEVLDHGHAEGTLRALRALRSN